MSRPTVFAAHGYEEALAATNLTGKLLVLDATASWCQPCKTMDEVTWVDPKVIAWLTDHAVALQVDVDEQKDLARSLGIRAMPTVIAFRGGKEVDRVAGMKSPGDLIAWLEAVQRGETSVDQLRHKVQANADDMQARYAFAKALASSRRFAEATDEYVWLWQHMLEHQPSMVGVRSSFMLKDIETLMRDHAPARTRFTELRDSLGKEGVAPSAPPQEIADWISLTRTLGEEDRTLDWFEHNAAALAARPELENILRGRLAPLLIERRRWPEVSRLYRDPLATLQQSHQRLEQVRRDAVPPGMEAMHPRLIESLEGLLRTDAGVMVASLMAAGREPEARAVVEEIRRVSPGEATEQALAQTAREAGVQVP